METKLETIKHAWQDHKKHMDLEHFALHYSKQIDWLIEQAEKVERYEKALKEITTEGCYDASCEKGVIATKVLFEEESE